MNTSTKKNHFYWKTIYLNTSSNFIYWTI